jgi:hypothetical protein
MAKGRDDENVRALETHMKAIAWKIEIEICVVMGFTSVVHRHMQLDSQPNDISVPLGLVNGKLK